MTAYLTSLILSREDLAALIFELLGNQQDWQRAWGDTPHALDGVLAAIREQHPAVYERVKRKLEGK